MGRVCFAVVGAHGVAVDLWPAGAYRYDVNLLAGNLDRSTNRVGCVMQTSRVVGPGSERADLRRRLERDGVFEVYGRGRFSEFVAGYRWGKRAGRRSLVVVLPPTACQPPDACRCCEQDHDSARHSEYLRDTEAALCH